MKYNVWPVTVGGLKLKYTVRLEEANGELASLGMYVRAIVKTQDMEAWKNQTPDAFQTFLRACMADYVRNLEVKIHRAKAPALEREAV